MIKISEAGHFKPSSYVSGYRNPPIKIEKAVLSVFASEAYERDNIKLSFGLN